MMSPPRFPPAARKAFTLLEVLVASVVFLILMGILAVIFNTTAGMSRSMRKDVSAFQQARAAFESVGRRLSLATLNTYYDYEYDADGQPVRYRRQSDLQMLAGPASVLIGDPARFNHTHTLAFVSTTGHTLRNDMNILVNLLNVWGYAIEFGDDARLRPSFMPSSSGPRYRYRLVELWEPTEDMTLLNLTTAPNPDQPSYTGFDWLKDSFLTQNRTRVLAENIVAMVVTAKLSASQDPPNANTPHGGALYQSPPNFNLRYVYNSRSSRPFSIPGATGNSIHQLPPIINLTMIAIDEASASRLASEFGSARPLPELENLFQDPQQFNQDLAAAESALRAKRVNYRIFSSDFHISGAKWSND